jgi:hypothetical protein
MNPSSRFAAITALLLAAPVTSAFSGPVDVGYRYDLSDFTGTIPYTDARIVADAVHDEALTIYANEVRIFNGSGMQTFAFSMQAQDGHLVDLAVDDGGDMLLLVYESMAGAGTTNWSLRRLDYRGRFEGNAPLNRPADLAGFYPNRVLYRGQTLWLISELQMMAAAFSTDGTFLRSLDLAEIAGVAPEDRPNVQIGGCDVDASGAIAFTIPVYFRVYVVATDGSARSFGKSGSAAGNFGLATDVAFDGNGHIVVSDRLRNVVIVFDDQFRFMREFGQTGGRHERLTRPGALALGGGGKLYISQLRNRGVAVFAMISEQ